MKNTLLMLLAVFMVSAYAVSSHAGESAADAGEESDIAEYTFPVIEPEFFLFGGYRMTGLSGSERAAEYEYVTDSIMIGGELRMIQMPHRLHLDLDIKNRKDFFGDISYAYKDMVVFRAINSTLFHNLDNILLIDLNPASRPLPPNPSGPAVDIRDSNEKYGIKAGMSTMFLRLKTPDFPFHAYVKSSFIGKNGSMQQRFLGGSAYFLQPSFRSGLDRVSAKRSIDWETTQYTIGINSHLGPIEVDISHGEKRFDVKGNEILFYDYLSARTTPVRPAGAYPHNLVPELKSSSNTLRIHTSHTGRLVAAATFTKIDKENRDSGAKADYFIGSGEITWMPLTKLTFFLKYRHKETDIDNPDTAGITNRTTAATYTYAVRKSVSSVTDSVSVTARYRPLSGVTLRGEYSYEHVDRKDHEAWEIPETTEKNMLSLSADLRVLKNVKLTAKYKHKEISNPAYNTEPNRSDEGILTVSWIPVPKLNTLVSYSIAKEKREDLHFLGTDAPDKKQVKRDRLLGSATVMLFKDLSATASYAYMHNRVKQDIVYQDTTGAPFVDSAIPYRDTAHSYALDMNYMPKNNITLSAGVSHTISKGTFSPDDPNLTQPVSIASFSELKIKETMYSASGEYRFKQGIAAGIQYLYSRFNDAVDYPYDDVSDGRAYRILLTLSRKW